jgi:hypothetical protein
MTMIAYEFVAQNYGTSSALPDATVSVFVQNSLTPASLYNLAGAAIANPMTADTNGFVIFQIAAGNYTVQVSQGAYTSPLYLLTDVMAESPFASTLTALAGGLSTETGRAEAAESTLTTNLATEASTRGSAVTTLTTNLAAEVTRAEAAESTLTTNLAAEVTRAQGAEATLTANVAKLSLLKLNGSAALWADQGVANGGAFVANSFNAVQALEAQMRAYGVLDEAIYVLPFAGSNQAMARTPLVDLFGNQFPTVISGGGGFTETSGLTGVVLQTGIPPDYVGMMFAGGIGIYSLVDQAGGYVPAVGCASSYSFYGLLPNYSNYAVYSMPGGSGSVEGNLQYEAGDGSFGYTTKGAMFGARDDAARAFIYRNNTQMPVQSAAIDTSQYFAPGQRLSGSTPPTTDTVQINSTLSALGMVVICRGDFDANKVIIWSFIMQTLQKNLNRAVIPDGLS